MSCANIVAVDILPFFVFLLKKRIFIFGACARPQYCKLADRMLRKSNRSPVSISIDLILGDLWLIHTTLFLLTTVLFLYKN